VFPIPGASIMHARNRITAPLAALVVLATCAATVSRAQVVLEGHVADDLTGAGLGGAQVLLLDRHNRTVAYQETDDSGHFHFSRSEFGWYRFEVKAIGYLKTLTPFLRWTQDHSYADLEVRLAPHTVLLAPLEVVALSPALASPVLENAVHRRSYGFGIQLTREDIEKRHPASIIDMLTELPGVYAMRRGSGASARALYMGRALYGPGGGACPVQIFLDGRLATRDAPGGDVTVDDLVSPLDVEMVEVFRGLSSIPPEFLNEYARCGVIAIWTKRAQ
jgi:hypothetical protein